MTDSSEQPIRVTGTSNVMMASYITLRVALSLEVRGMKKHGRSARTIANEHMGTSHRTAEDTYIAFDKWLVENHGAQPRPLR